MIASSFFAFNNPLDYIGWVIGIIGILFTVYYANKSSKRRKPVYLSRSTRLIKETVNQIDSLEVFYNKKKLNALTISKVAFWNAGKETISNTDLSRKDQLRIETRGEYEILSCDIIKQSKEANNFSVQLSEDKKAAIISFDYIDYEEGAVFKIRHTGSTSSDIIIKGSIKTVKTIERKSRPYLKRVAISDKRKQKVLKMFETAVFIVGVVFVIQGMASALSIGGIWHQTQIEQWLYPFNNWFSSVFLIIIGCAYIALLIFISHKPLPKYLMGEFFNEDF